MFYVLLFFFFSIQNRLNYLAILSIHRNIHVNVEEVLNQMARKRRRIDIIG